MRHPDKRTVSDIMRAVAKKAIGYEDTEVVEEYVVNAEGEEILTKKKITTKRHPPDIAAARVVLGEDSIALSDLAVMTREELDALAERLKIVLGGG
ncbi:MAG: hypothetical protein LBM78_02445 [Clostridiales bacterium]|jgi:hypothetical protein|nr:hypothetical protein [Clostridiales bacterium]